METGLKAGDPVRLGDREFVVSDLAAAVLPVVRGYLVGVARAGGTVTYGEMKKDLELPYPTNGMGHLLDVLSADCIERDEPSLAALVVTSETLEVGSGYVGDPAMERKRLYWHWLSETLDDSDDSEDIVRGVCPECGSPEVTHVVWGLVDPYAVGETPPWLIFGGCVLQPYDAVCDSCGQKWRATEDGESALLPTPGDRHFYAGATSDEELGRWISERTELDAHIDRCDAADDLVVCFRDRGIGVEFPLTLEQFWATVHEFHAEVVEELEQSE